MNLILAPLAQVLLPGAAAVRLTAGLGGILNSGLLLTGWRLIVWRSVLCLVAPAVAATLVLGPVISRIGAGPVSVAVAVITVLAIAASVWHAAGPGHRRGWRPHRRRTVGRVAQAAPRWPSFRPRNGGLLRCGVSFAVLRGW